MQPHVRKFHWGLKLLWLDAWKLSSDLFARQAFLKRLQRLSLQTSGKVVQSPPLVLRTEYCSIQGHCSADSRILSVSATVVKAVVPAIKGYRSTLNHVLTQAGMDLAAYRVISSLFNIFEKSGLPKEIKPLE